MSDLTNTKNGGLTERRKGDSERRASDERRNEGRLSYMKGECRGNAPRRASDFIEAMDEGELWWSGV